MTTRTLLLGAVAFLACASGASAANFQGWYVSMEAGVNFLDDADVDNDTIDPTFLGGFPPTTASFDTGWAGMFSLGHSWGDWRTEIEFAYRDNDLEDFVVQGFNNAGGGTFEEFAIMGNLVYDWRLSDRWSLALGAGLGMDQIHYDNDSGWHTVPIHDNEWVFAWQLIAGFNYELDNQNTLFVNYRYFNASDAEFTEVDGLGDLHNDSYDDITKHAVTIGWRHDLIEDASLVEPAPPQEAAPPPPPPPPARNFVIYFDPGKCNLSGEADAVLSEAASAAKATGSASVRVVGHTDTAGSGSSNQKLSECRADAAKSNLVSKGVPAGSISASGRGETETAVQTGDGVREPQNNRVVIDLQ
jgi:OOP family OmpA-OmpF porin